MKRSPMRQQYRPTGPDAATVELVRERDGYRCIRCGALADGPRGVNWAIHHRRPRGMGGTDRPDANSAANLLCLCPQCHTHVESHRAEAWHNGWIVSQLADPAAVSVLVDQQSRWVYLGDDGAYHDNPEGVTQ